MNITVLEWPANLPNINPIESFWSIRKERLKRVKVIVEKLKLIFVIIRLRFYDKNIKKNCKELIDYILHRVKILIKTKYHTKR